jgi:cytochrome c553
MELILIMLIAGVAVAAAFWPAIRGNTGAAAARPTILLDDAAIDAEVSRYRAALRAGTLCGRCHFANPPGSRYCADCGRVLPAATEA